MGRLSEKGEFLWACERKNTEALSHVGFFFSLYFSVKPKTEKLYLDKI